MATGVIWLGGHLVHPRVLLGAFKLTGVNSSSKIAHPSYYKVEDIIKAQSDPTFPSPQQSGLPTAAAPSASPWRCGFQRPKALSSLSPHKLGVAQLRNFMATSKPRKQA